MPGGDMLNDLIKHTAEQGEIIIALRDFGRTLLASKKELEAELKGPRGIKVENEEMRGKLQQSCRQRGLLSIRLAIALSAILAMLVFGGSSSILNRGEGATVVPDDVIVCSFAIKQSAVEPHADFASPFTASSR